MAESDFRDEDLDAFSNSFITDLQSFLSSLLTDETQTSEESLSVGDEVEQDNEGQDQANDDLSNPEEESHLFDISATLQSVASEETWTLGRIAMLPNWFSAPGLEEENSCSLDDEDENTEVNIESEKENELCLSIQSKYITDFPLYQDYSLQALKSGLQQLDLTCLSELIETEFVQSVQSHIVPRSLLGSTSTGESEPSPSAQPIKVTPCSLWQELDEVKASGLLNSLTTREIRLQESMFELIASEASYLRSLSVTVNHFQSSKALKQTLSRMEHHVLFSNIRHVMEASEKFLMDLELRLGENVFMSEVGDIVLKHSSEFHRLYVPYVTNMMYQEALVNRLLQQNRDFVFSLKRLQSDSVCQRQELKSFLVLPFQRITRVKLLLQNILKVTEPDSTSVSTLEQAIKAVHEIVSDCNKGVETMKQTEELVCLESLLDFGKIKSVPVVVSGRHLVQQGSMRQMTVEGNHNSRLSFITVHLHLFNDLLIISSKKDQRFIVLDHAEFPAHVRVEHLKTEVLSLPPNSILLHLTQNQAGHPTAMILVTDKRSDKDRWMKLLTSKRG